jgi:hypothetical protein
MGIVAIVLGTVGMRAVGADIYRFVYRPTQRMFWVSVHLEKFIGSYIAIWTAFSVATLSRVFHDVGLTLWLWPAFVGIPAIIAASAYYRRQFASPGEASART